MMIISSLTRLKTASLIFLMVSAYGISHAEKSLGWNLVNTTDHPIGVAWYENLVEEVFEPGRIYGKRKKEILTGIKKRCSEPIVLEPQTSYFLVSNGKATQNRHQLTFTSSPLLLKPLLDEKEPGSLQGLVFINNSASVLEEMYEQNDPAAKKLYIHRPEGCCTLTVLSQAKPITQEQLLKKGWALKNLSTKTLYIGRYISHLDKVTKTYGKPALELDQYIIEIEPQKTIILPDLETTRDTSETEHQNLLCMSFDKDAFGLAVSLQVHRVPQEELRTFGTQWHVYDEKGLPQMVPHTNFISMINTTNKPFYGAFYYVGKTGAVKFGPSDLITSFAPHLQVEMAFPVKKADHEVRLLIASEDQKHLLKEASLTIEQRKQLVSKSFEKTNIFNWYAHGTFAIEINWCNPHSIYITSIGSGLFEYLARKMIDIYPLAPTTCAAFEKKFLENHPDYLPAQEIVAAYGKPSVLTRSTDRVLEHTYIAKRSDIVRKAINKLLGYEYITPGDPIPRIALAFTGGGYRAMIETIGFLQGAADEEGGNILDCCTYMMGLSGSSWAVMPLVASGLTPTEFAARQRNCVGKGGMPTLRKLISNLIYESPEYSEKRFIQSRYGQFHGPIGLYGHALAHALLDGMYLNGRDKHSMTLSDVRTKLEDARYPYPICVAMEPGGKDEERVWYEFSPHYFGTKQEKGGWIDTKFLGSVFYEGKIVHCAPEYPLANSLGIWGSAFALTSQDVAKESNLAGLAMQAYMGISATLARAYNLLLQKASDDPLACGRLTAGTIPNYNYKRSLAHEGVSAKPLLHLVDGGIAKEGSFRHNFATIPALWRNVDILIMCDCTDTPNSDDSANLRASDEEARRQKLSFPNLTRSTKHKKTLDSLKESVASLFVEKKAPVVMYIKAKRNAQYDRECALSGVSQTGFDPDVAVAGFTNTSNFNYTPSEFDIVCGLTRSIMIQSKNIFKDALEISLKRLSRKDASTSS